MNCFRRILTSLVLISCGWVGLIANADELKVAESNQPAPNIVFVFADDLGWGDLGVFYQNHSKHSQVHKTPHLDKMALNGLQMRAHYCPAPVCAPSRSSLLTGVHQGNAVVRDNQFDKALEDNHTLGTVLQSAGYRTCMIGKYGLQGKRKDKRRAATPAQWPSYPTRRGFDEFFGYVSHAAGHHHYPVDPWKLGNEGQSKNVKLWQSDEKGDHEISASLSKCYTTDLFTARAKHFLVEHKLKREGQPFFLMLNYDTPHAALQIPSQSYPDGGGIDGGLQWTGGDEPANISQPAINTASGTVDSYRHPDYVNKGWKDVDERFATMVRRIDSAVGDLNETLTELGLAENTLVIFTSDNGPHHESYIKANKSSAGRYSPEAFQSYGPFDGTKRDCWEGGIRMPTLVCWKGKIEKGRIDSTPSQFHDWMATFCDVASVPVPARCDGVSLKPTLIGAGKQAASTVYIEYVSKARTMEYMDFLPQRRGQFRKQMQVVRMPSDDGVWYKGIRVNIKSADDDFEIYDIENDVNEANDLASTTEEMQRLQKKMKSHVLQIRSVNKSAPRPYDSAMIPATTEHDAAFSLSRVPLPSVSYVSSVGEGSAVSDPKMTVGKANDWVQFSAEEPGIYELQGSLTSANDGQHTLSLETSAAAFVRLHAAHAFDVPAPNVASEHVVTRNLVAGNHPVKMTVRIEDANTPVRLSLIQQDD